MIKVQKVYCHWTIYVLRSQLWYVIWVWEAELLVRWNYPQNDVTEIDHYKKHGGMYILPEYTAGIKYIELKRTRSIGNGKKF